MTENFTLQSLLPKDFTESIAIVKYGKKPLKIYRIKTTC